MKKTAVVILNYNGREHLETYLPHVIKHSQNDADIYVVDNCSTDESVPFLKENYPSIPIVELSKNYGFAGGYNEGLKQIKAKYYVLLNSDVRPTENWVAYLEQHMEHNPSTGACIGKVKADKRPDFFEHAGAAGGFLDRLGYAFCRGRILDVVEEDKGQYDTELSVAWASGCALFIRAELYHKALGFDGSYFAHYEEIDLCWRIRRMGYKIMVIPNSVVYHLGGGTLPYNSPNKVYLNFRNSLFTIYKNASNAFLKIFLRLILDGIAGLQFLLKLEYKNTWAIVRAHFSFYSHLAAMSKRKSLEGAAIKELSIGKANKDGMTSKLLIWEYFVHKKRRFSQIEKTR